MATLNLYRSSAGSGKTHTLVSAYLRLALESPGRFREILAVTFTNQATREMKQRILTYLHGLAQGLDGPVAQELMQGKGWGRSELQKRAQGVLSSILHDYDRFTVSTIDSFFQAVVRGFAQELGLPQGFRVEMDQGAVLDTIIDGVIAAAGHDKQLQQWLLRFAEHRILDGRFWDFKGELKELGYALFTEAFSAQEGLLLDVLSNAELLDGFLGKLRQEIVGFESRLQGLGGLAVEAMDRAGLTVADFAYGGRGVAGYLVGLEQQRSFVPTKRALLALQCIESWYSKSTNKRQQIVGVVEGDLQDILAQAIGFYQRRHRTYYTALAIERFVYALGVIEHLLAGLNDYRARNNVMLVSDAASLLRQIIAENDMPFVYEKIGAFYKHFLIDEFQDISGFQWQNFKPLINNGLAAGHMSLLVGDAKQSIYRWRGGNWRLLLTQLEKEVDRVTASALNYNWRSKRHIVNFNNTLFTEASGWLVEHLQEEWGVLEEAALKQALAEQAQALKAAYQDVYQHIPLGCAQDDLGYVNITFLRDEEEGSLDWRAQVKARLPLLLEALQADGFALKDIALLVRSNAEGRELLQALLAYQQSAQAKPGYRYEAISAESLYLGHSPWVNILLKALQCLVNVEDRLVQAELAYLYQVYVLQEAHPVFHTYWQAAGLGNARVLSNPFLPQAFGEAYASLQQLPLYELVEALVRIFRLQRAEAAPFIEAFQEVVLNYSQQGLADIHHFLAWWSARGGNLAMPCAGGQDAVSIMTIHQAKGLQFKVVVLPFCAWDFDHNPRKSPIIWCSTSTPPFSTFPALPLRYGSKLKDTVYVRDYYEERMQAYLDNLNLLYVAFTRAEDRLYAFAGCSGRGALRTTADLLYHIFGQGERQPVYAAGTRSYLRWQQHWNATTEVLELGELRPVAGASSGGLMRSGQPYLTGDWRHKLVSHAEHTPILDVAPSSNGLAGQYVYMHYILTKLQKEDELPKVLATLQVGQGLDQAEIVALERQFRELMCNPTIRAWYDGTWAVKYHTSLIAPTGQMYRPDRIMMQGTTAMVVDFTVSPEQESSQEELLAAASLLQNMGYGWVRAYRLDIPTQVVHELCVGTGTV